MEEVKIKGYIDPRTGERKDFLGMSDAESQEVISFIFASRMYWDGPVLSSLDEENQPYGEPVYDRETWINSDLRQEWLNSLNEGQRKMLSETLPPEQLLAVENS